MSKFFVETNQIENDKISIIGQDVNHIKNVLRLKENDKIEVCDKEENVTYVCEILDVQTETVTCKILERKNKSKESNIDITIFQGLPKFDKMELIIQKCTELGVKKIVPVKMERCIVKLDDKTSFKKIERWQKIAEVASKQCTRDAILEIENVIDIKNICNLICEYDIVLLAYEKEETLTLKQAITELKSVDKKDFKIGVIIGPEGGLTIEEVEILKNAGAKSITLGKRILRTETVALTMAAILNYELEK